MYLHCMQSVPITNKVMSLNPAHGDVYSIQYYVIKFVSDLRQVSSTSKTDHHDMTGILIIVESGVKHHNLNSYTCRIEVINYINFS